MSALFTRSTTFLVLLLLLAAPAILAGCCCAGGIDDEEIDLNLDQPQDNPIPPVAAVSADPSQGVEPLEVQLDATESYDPDGTIVKYDWDFDSDGTFDLMDGGATPTHTFASSVSFVQTAQFEVTVRVTDDDGLTDDASTTVTVGELLPPVAVVSATPNSGVEPLEVQLDASDSYDDDGTIVQYDWDFDGDGSYDLMDGGATPMYTYSSSVSLVETGQFDATVRVTDDDGLTDTASTTVTIGELAPPTAALAATPETGTVPVDITWDASGSTDPDGTIVQYDWDMDNDGTFEIEDGGDNQVVNYTEGGMFTVGVRVTDDDGLTDSTTATVDLNIPPVAALEGEHAIGGDQESWDITWDASGSTDSDGTIVKYDWDMDNDGTFEIEDGGDSQVQNTFDPGEHTVGVRVTDDDGATDQTTATVDILLPPVAVLKAEATSGASAGDGVGTAPIEIAWDGLDSFDDDGTIEQYDWDMDNDGTFELIDSTDTRIVNYNVGGLVTVGLRVTDDEGLTDSTTLTIDINNPPTAVLTNTTEEVPEQERWDVHWDASGSFDDDGTVVRYDWDLDNNGVFEVLDGGSMQTTPYDDFNFEVLPTVGVRVYDNDGAEDMTVHTATFSPVVIVIANPGFGFVGDDIMFNATFSFDPDGGTIEQYDWDMDNDGTYEIIDGDATQTRSFGTEGPKIVKCRVTDDEGVTAEGEGSIFISTIPN